MFPWKSLAEAGHGLWVEPPPSPGAPLAKGDNGTGVFALRAGFSAGSAMTAAPSGEYDDDTGVVVSAFQRHWRPSVVDGVADGETRARLVQLLRATAG